MAGVTSSYVVEPNGECVIGLVLAGGMRVRRGAERHDIGPGELCAWDPSARHEGRPHRSDRWRARLIVLEAPAVEALAVDAEGPWRPPPSLPGPVLRDASLARGFLALHRELEDGSSALAVDVKLTEWFTALIGDPAPSPAPPARSALRDPALRRARDLLADDPAANVSLDVLAAAAGVSRHRLTRLFRAAYGLPPHRFQLAQRVRLARSLLEQGRPVAEVALETGFGDQSHLHRHFRRTLGITPARYRALMRSNVQDGRAERA